MSQNPSFPGELHPKALTKRLRRELLQTLRWLEVGQRTSVDVQAFDGLLAHPAAYLRGKFQFEHPAWRFNVKRVDVLSTPYFEITRRPDDDGTPKPPKPPKPKSTRGRGRPPRDIWA